MAGALAVLSATLMGAAVDGAHAQVEPPPVAQCSSIPMPCPQSDGKLKLDVVRRTLSWKLTTRGVDIPDVANPAVDAGYDLCIYDASDTLVVATGVPAGGVCEGGFPCWRARPWGFQYRDRTGTNGGLTKILLRASGRRDRFTVTGAGAFLPLPVEPPALPLKVQLVRTNPLACWTSIATKLP